MQDITVEFPNRDDIYIGVYDYNNDTRFIEYMKETNNEHVSKELCRIDNILEDNKYWQDNNTIHHENIFGDYYVYTKRNLEVYKNMLLASVDMV